MGKVCTKHILTLLWKMIETMFFKNYVLYETMLFPPHKKKLLFLLSGGGQEFPLKNVSVSCFNLVIYIFLITTRHALNSKNPVSRDSAMQYCENQDLLLSDAG